MSLIFKTVVWWMILWGVACQAETGGKDVRVRIEHQQVFDDDGTYKQPDVVIKRSSYKNNLKFEADRLEGREPPSRPGINQLIRDEHEESARRREELEAKDILQRYVGHADEQNKTRLIVSPRSEAYRAPNKAKPLPSLPRRGLTPVRPRPESRVDASSITNTTADRAADTATAVSVPAGGSKAPPVSPSVYSETPAVQIGTAHRRPLKNKMEAYTERSPVARKLISKPSYQRPAIAPEPRSSSIVAKPPSVPIPAASRSAGAAARLGQSSTGYPSIRVAPSGYYVQEPSREPGGVQGGSDNRRGEKPIVRTIAAPPEQQRPTHGDIRIAPSGYYVQELSAGSTTNADDHRGEKPVVRDIASPDTVYQQRLMQSDDEYLKLAPPELWENKEPVASESVDETVIRPVAEPVAELLKLSVWPGAVFDHDYVWGATPLAQTPSSMSEFAFGLPWQYLSKGWQIPALSTTDAAFAFLWFVVDLHQISRDAFKQRHHALQQQVQIRVRQRKVALLSGWLSESSPDYLQSLSQSDRFTWQQYLAAVQSELQVLPEQAMAGLTPGEQTLLNTLEQNEIGSLNDLVARYRQASLEKRFYRAYFQRLRRPGYGMATRLSEAELSTLADQEKELHTAFYAFQQDVAELNRVVARHEQGMVYIQHLMQQATQPALASGVTQNKLVAALMNELDREEILLLHRLNGYQNLWLMAWYTNQFSSNL